mmetsp:Transcript_2559/g.6989  ORF Transcript_2559/g.6989 Transcript_2559/m.6989 type:complete len:266 (-) Transcript_2559:1062-1859(-)
MSCRRRPRPRPRPRPPPPQQPPPASPPTPPHPPSPPRPLPPQPALPLSPQRPPSQPRLRAPLPQGQIRHSLRRQRPPPLPQPWPTRPTSRPTPPRSTPWPRRPPPWPTAPRATTPAPGSRTRRPPSGGCCASRRPQRPRPRAPSVSTATTATSTGSPTWWGGRSRRRPGAASGTRSAALQIPVTPVGRSTATPEVRRARSSGQRVRRCGVAGTVAKAVSLIAQQASTSGSADGLRRRRRGVARSKTWRVYTTARMGSRIGRRPGQ